MWRINDGKKQEDLADKIVVLQGRDGGGVAYVDSGAGC